jgi:hypothetical protein
MRIRPSTARPGSRALLLLLLASTGCVYSVTHIEVGAALDPEAFEKIDVGRDGRATVLERLGPPQEVHYGLEFEELVYLSKRHSGSDLRFVLPSELLPGFPFMGRIRQMLGFLFPPFQDHLEFTKGSSIRIARGLYGGVLSLMPVATGGNELLSLHGRRLDWERMRIVLDRDTWTVVDKSYEPLDDDPGRVGSALLRD